MNKKLFMILLAGLMSVFAISSCSDDNTVDPSAKETVIEFPYTEIVADLNVVDNLPVVAVIRSEAGLKSVDLNIRTSDNELVPVKSETKFFNPNSYSLSADVTYQSNYRGAVITAVDVLDRKMEQELPIQIIDVVDAPQIVFNPAEIFYDETVGGEMPKTHIEVSTTAQLKLVEIFRVTDKGQELFTQVGFSAEDPQQAYTFDEQVMYNEFDRGMKVKVVDNYNQVRIATLPVKYKTVPPPVMTPKEELIIAKKNENKPVEIAMTSEAGIVKVQMYRMEGERTIIDEVVEKTYSPKLNELNYAESIVFTNATTAIKVVATDNVNRSTEVIIPAQVNLTYQKGFNLGTCYLADGKTYNDQTINRFLSLSDLKTYTLQDGLDNPDLQKHFDVCCYYMNGNSASVRIYNINNEKQGEFKNSNGSLKNNFKTKNLTKFKVLDINFDKATAADIESIDAASLQSSYVKGKEEIIGKTIAFRFGGSSPKAGKVGLMVLREISDYKPFGVNKNARVFVFDVKLMNE